MNRIILAELKLISSQIPVVPATKFIPGTGTQQAEMATNQNSDTSA
jgi:hypothetical protein